MEGDETREDRIERMHKEKQKRISKQRALDFAIRTIQLYFGDSGCPITLDLLTDTILKIANSYYNWLISENELKNIPEELIKTIKEEVLSEIQKKVKKKT